MPDHLDPPNGLLDQSVVVPKSLLLHVSGYLGLFIKTGFPPSRDEAVEIQDKIAKHIMQPTESPFKPGVCYNVPDLQDYAGPLTEFSDILRNLILTHGPEARIEFDAGHNNVSVIVRHQKT